MTKYMAVLQLALIALFFERCNYEIKKAHSASASMTVEESKKYHVFLKEYNPVNKKLNDSIEFHIKQAFAETIYFKEDDTIRKTNEYQIVLIVDVDSNFKYIKENSFYWYLKEFDAQYVVGPQITKNMQMTNTHSKTPIVPDSIKIEVIKMYAGQTTNDAYISTDAGFFYIYKK